MQHSYVVVSLWKPATQIIGIMLHDDIETSTCVLQFLHGRNTSILPDWKVIIRLCFAESSQLLSDVVSKNRMQHGMSEP